jgi:AraC-like DNA-binding protein
MNSAIIAPLNSNTSSMDSTSWTDPPHTPQPASGERGRRAASWRDGAEVGREATWEPLKEWHASDQTNPPSIDKLLLDFARQKLSDTVHSIGIHVSAAPDVKQLAHAFGIGAKPRRKMSALPDWRLKRITEYVNEHLGDAIRLEDLAKAAGLTRMYFAAQFRASVGMCPHDYLTRERLKRAQILLYDPHRTLVDVALSVGFQTQSHFTTVFGRYIGNTPGRWRMEHCFKNHREAKDTPLHIRTGALRSPMRMRPR